MKTQANTTPLMCDGQWDGCAQRVTHLDEKGYGYCKPCALVRRGSGIRCRALAVWELRQIQRGEPLKSYEPQRKPCPAVEREDSDSGPRPLRIYMNDDTEDALYANPDYLGDSPEERDPFRWTRHPEQKGKRNKERKP